MKIDVVAIEEEVLHTKEFWDLFLHKLSVNEQQCNTVNEQQCNTVTVRCSDPAPVLPIASAQPPGGDSYEYLSETRLDDNKSNPQT